LGFDDPMSADHDWGPRVQVFLSDSDLFELLRPLGSAMRSALPEEFLGYPTFFAENEDGTQAMGRGRSGRPGVEFLSWATFQADTVGFETGPHIKPFEWLAIPQQALLELTQGKFFRDDLGLEEGRRVWRSYPDDVWRYILAGLWERVGEEEHLTGRAGYTGDEIGAKLIAGRLVRDLMRIGFMMERRYAPYPKWFGSAFAQLSLGPELMPMLDAVLSAEGWEARDSALAAAFEATARHHNRRGITEPISETCAPFYGRPFRVFHLHAKVSERLVSQIEDPEVSEMAKERRIGNIDTFSDSTALLCDRHRRTAIQRLYGPFEENTPKKS